jgi:hypothetical protein
VVEVGLELDAEPRERRADLVPRSFGVAHPPSLLAAIARRKGVGGRQPPSLLRARYGLAR